MEMAQASPGMPGQVQASTQPSMQQPQGGPAGATASEYPDWMTDDDKQFAEMSRQAARNYKSQITKRRQGRAMTSQYNKLSKASAVARGNMETIAGVMKSQPEMYFEEDGKTPNAYGMSLLRQLGKHREDYKRAKQAEAEFLKQMSGAGLGDEDLAAIGTAGDQDFDDFVERGFANALAFSQQQRQQQQEQDLLGMGP